MKKIMRLMLEMMEIKELIKLSKNSKTFVNRLKFMVIRCHIGKI